MAMLTHSRAGKICAKRHQPLSSNGRLRIETSAPQTRNTVRTSSGHRVRARYHVYHRRGSYQNRVRMWEDHVTWSPQYYLSSRKPPQINTRLETRSLDPLQDLHLLEKHRLAARRGLLCRCSCRLVTMWLLANGCGGWDLKRSYTSFLRLLL